ncbi:hypothetical protein LTR22_014688 [Elasticomyces elasticus]|nr:hypothetical protein LTR22_014688 [Elasticomyces elasticus]KAK4930749.1 hypothetical protein LTR49_002837 [Elasticomyces elasticus]KAK5755622.1 hypothetical protein LTS12_014281 [Elasticomyces elasticus]
MAAEYSKLRVTDLKDLLKERGIPSTGLTRKQSIIEALEAKDASSTDDTNTAVAVDAPTTEVVEGGGEVEADHAEKIEDEGAEMKDAVEEVEREEGGELGGAEAEGEAEVATPESRKRKRRSATPEVSEEGVSKKLKAAEDKNEEVKLVEDAPVPLDGAADTKPEAVAETVQPYSTSDDLHTLPQTEDIAMDDAPTGAFHPATRALYISSLTRPLQPQQLRDHLSSLAGGTFESEPPVETFHLHLLRTHAFAVFTTLKEATRVRSLLHGTVFPDEPARKPVSVDFVPEEEVGKWIDVEMAAGTNRRDAKRWEVLYSNTEEGVKAEHVEVTGTSASGPGRQNSMAQQQQQQGFGAGAGMGTPTAPSGPRGNAARMPAQPQQANTSERRQSNPIIKDEEMPDTDTAGPVGGVEANPTHGPSTSSFTTLAKTFLCTTTKPHLYYLPKAEALAESRVRKLTQETSRDWDGGRAGDGVGVGGALRRYTFEDGDKLVDGGPDRGSFGVPGGFGGDGYRGDGYRGRGRGRGGIRGGGGFRGGFDDGGYGGGGGGYRGGGGGYRGGR